MKAGAPMGASANASRKPSMLFPFWPEQPCRKQYSEAHRIEAIHSAAIKYAMYLTMRILIITTQHKDIGAGRVTQSMRTIAPAWTVHSRRAQMRRTSNPSVPTALQIPAYQEYP
jgi:hypothetical protein